MKLYPHTALRLIDGAMLVEDCHHSGFSTDPTHLRVDFNAETSTLAFEEVYISENGEVYTQKNSGEIKIDPRYVPAQSKGSANQWYYHHFYILIEEVRASFKQGYRFFDDVVGDYVVMSKGQMAADRALRCLVAKKKEQQIMEDSPFAVLLQA